jgi:topoisomerase IA-like protein
MSDPKYYSHLRLVIDLQSRIIQLEHALASLIQPRPTMKVPTKKVAAKKTVAKKAAAKPRISKTPPRPYNVKQFKRGAAGH